MLLLLLMSGRLRFCATAWEREDLLRHELGTPTPIGGEEVVSTLRCRSRRVELVEE